MPIELLLTILAVLLLLADMRQTLDIKNHPDLHEINPLLGEHPTDKRVYMHFFCGITAFLGIAYFLPGQAREIWVGALVAIELFFVLQNYQIGLKL